MDAGTDKAGTSDCTFLALLWAPSSMPYSPGDLLSLTPEDVKLKVTLIQNDTNGDPVTVSNYALLEPPPLVLVHGVWSSAAEAWPTFRQWLPQNYPYTVVFPANYGTTSELSYKSVVNQQVLAQTIANAISTYATKGIATQKVDIVAHSTRVAC